ncbi:MAG: 4Fe-4S binding protein, partial [Acidobacteria bacterium]|nr:4Fe-4S binding protein [Acidobacteriota bacterium]
MKPGSPVFPILNNRAGAPSAQEQGQSPENRNDALRRLAAVVVLMAGAILPAWLAGVAANRPQTRDIHIEAYRYGFSPSRIHVNRGDRLRLTFSTRDTGQSFFFQDYDLHVAITPGNKLVAVQRLSRPDDPPEVVETVELVAGLPGWQGWLVSKSQFRNHTYNGPMHGTERGDLIVAPNLLLHGSLGLLAAIPLAGLILARNGAKSRGERRFNLFSWLPWLKRVMKAPSFQFNVALPMLGVFWFIILAGLFGTKVAGRNAGPMIIWVLWLSALIILLVPIGGRIWCTVCPLPLIGEWSQRRRLSQKPAGAEVQSPRRVLGVPLIWPSWLSNAWPRVLLFLLLGTFSTAIVAVPAATSWMLIGLVVMATVVSVFPEQRLFCRHLCPINSYISLYSTTG